MACHTPQRKSIFFFFFFAALIFLGAGGRAGWVARAVNAIWKRSTESARTAAVPGWLGEDANRRRCALEQTHPAEQIGQANRARAEAYHRVWGGTPHTSPLKWCYVELSGKWGGGEKREKQDFLLDFQPAPWAAVDKQGQTLIFASI